MTITVRQTWAQSTAVQQGNMDQADSTLTTSASSGGFWESPGNITSLRRTYWHSLEYQTHLSCSGSAMWGRVPKESLSLWSYRDGGIMTATISAMRTLLNVAVKDMIISSTRENWKWKKIKQPIFYLLKVQDPGRQLNATCCTCKRLYGSAAWKAE